jgi:hypothetical protein
LEGARLQAECSDCAGRPVVRSGLGNSRLKRSA